MLHYTSIIIVIDVGCVMSPWLFNVYMAAIARKVTIRMLIRGLSLVGDDGIE